MLTGVILAGGESSRMGINKALLPFGGEMMAERQIRLMSELCPHIMLVTNDPSDYRRLDREGLEFIPDRYPGHGPISGLHAALSRSDSPIWVVGCDQPFLSSKAARVMRDIAEEEDMEAVIPVLDGRPQMLHAVYTHSCLSPVQALIRQQKYRLTDILDHIRWKELDAGFFLDQGIPVDFSFDMDTPEAYREGLDSLE
jgi:molybdopterin-guanine dinucleotide biosynthesis protein A